MKSQDILLLLKLVRLSDQDRFASYSISAQPNTQPHAQPLIEEVDSPCGEQARKSTVLHVSEPRQKLQATSLPTTADHHTVRSLALATDISKSQVSLSLARCYEARLARPYRQNNAAQVIGVNHRALRVSCAWREVRISGALRWVHPWNTDRLGRTRAAG